MIDNCDGQFVCVNLYALCQFCVNLFALCQFCVKLMLCVLND